MSLLGVWGILGTLSLLEVGYPRGGVSRDRVSIGGIPYHPPGGRVGTRPTEIFSRFQWMFGRPFAVPQPTSFSAADETFAKDVMSMWTDFAKYG